MDVAAEFYFLWQLWGPCQVYLMDLGRGTALPSLLAIMNGGIQTLWLEGQSGKNRNEKEGANVSGWMPLLHPEMIFQICTGSGESKQGTLWRVFMPVPCPSGIYSGRQLSRGLCQIVSLLSALLLQDAQKDCVVCAGYISHTTWLFYSPQPCWDIPTRLLMFDGGWMFMLFSSYCPLVTAAGTVWFCCWQSKGDEQ